MDDPRRLASAWGQGDEATSHGPLSTQPGSDPSARGPAPAAPPGRRLGHYTLVRRLGAGGMGEVFEAHHVETGERVALKLLSKVDATRLYRFKREFRALAGVSHPNLIRLGELVVPPEGPAFFTMELLDGVPLVEYVRAGVAAGRAPDPLRLRRALRQLVAGVVCMHDAHCIHRDLKPSNVLVTKEGRVVILDFGLVAASDDPGQGMTRDGQVLGTPAYMAPEQAGPESRGEPVDYYALGVILYESLTGTLPFTGAPLQILVRKQQSEAPDPEAVVTGIPAELRELCIDLLARDPGRRPTGAQILSRLRGADAGLDDLLGRPARADVRVPFIGRARELELLETALRDVRTQRDTVTVHVRGTSGMGKTALLGELLRRAKAELDGLTILRGRCFERESVPYKGVDAVIDALAAWLRRLPEDERERIRPRHLEPLTRIFPVLDAVWTGNLVEPSDHPPHELRRLGLVALRELMTRLAERRVLIVHVDDFQWADEDGARLLGALVRPPDAPPMLLVVSFRDEVDEHEALRVLVSREERLGRDVRELGLDPLPTKDAEALAQALIAAQGPGTSIQTARRVRASVERARGNPFFLGQLVGGEPLGSDEDLPLDHVVVQRIAQLEDDARRVLAIVATAGGPVALSIVGRIFGDPRWDGLVSTLEELGLVTRRRTIDSESTDSVSSDSSSVVEMAHDRIREVVLGELGTSELQSLHLAHADELEHSGEEPESIAEHLLRGGARQRALEHVERAAERAAEALAFGRAATLYRQALELLGTEESGQALARHRHLRMALARQLVDLGHCSEAGDLLHSLAEQAPVERALVLDAEAAEQWLHAGRTEEGVDLALLVLRRAGEPTPRGFLRSLLRFAWERLRLWIRGIDYVLRPRSEISRTEFERVELLWRIALGFTTPMTPRIPVPVLQPRLVRFSLDLGDPQLVGRSLLSEMLVSKLLGFRKRAWRLEARARAIIEQTGDLRLGHILLFFRGLVHFDSGSFADAADDLGTLCKRIMTEPTSHGVRTSAMLHYVFVCIGSGRWRQVEQQLPHWLVAARIRGNAPELAELEAQAAVLHALLGDPERSSGHLHAARSVRLPVDYTVTHFSIDLCEGNVLVAEGDLQRALELAEKLGERLSQLSRFVVPGLRRLQRRLVARCRLLLALAAPSNPARQRAIRTALRRLRRSRQPVDSVELLLGRAALASLRGDDTSTTMHWRQAEALCVEHRLEAHLAAIRWRLGQLDEGEEASERRRLARAYARDQALKEPERIFDLLAPAHRRP